MQMMCWFDFPPTAAVFCVIKVLKQRILHTNNILFIFLVLEDVLFTLAIQKNFDSIILCLLCFMNWWYSWGVIHSLYRIVDVCIFFFYSCNILQPYLLAMVWMSSDAVFILHGCFTNLTVINTSHR